MMAVEARDDKLDRIKVPFPYTILACFQPPRVTLRPQMCIDDNRCFLVSLCLEQQWSRVLELLSEGWSARAINAQFKVCATCQRHPATP